MFRKLQLQQKLVWLFLSQLKNVVRSSLADPAIIDSDTVFLLLCQDFGGVNTILDILEEE